MLNILIEVQEMTKAERDSLANSRILKQNQNSRFNKIAKERTTNATKSYILHRVCGHSKTQRLPEHAVEGL